MQTFISPSPPAETRTATQPKTFRADVCASAHTLARPQPGSRSTRRRYVRYFRAKGDQGEVRETASSLYDGLIARVSPRLRCSLRRLLEREPSVHREICKTAISRICLSPRRTPRTQQDRGKLLHWLRRERMYVCRGRRSRKNRKNPPDCRQLTAKEEHNRNSYCSAKRSQRRRMTSATARPNGGRPEAKGRHQNSQTPQTRCKS